MKYVKGLALCVAAQLVSCAILGAQSVRLAITVSPVVRDSLARAWDDTTPGQVERGYCLTVTPTAAPYGVLRLVLTGFARPDTLGRATPYAIDFRCPAGTLELHTHTPTTCPMAGAFDHDLRHCVVGGPDAWLCYPSDVDRLSLTARGDPVAFVQCDRNAMVPYGPFPRHTP